MYLIRVVAVAVDWDLLNSLLHPQSPMSLAIDSSADLRSFKTRVRLRNTSISLSVTGGYCPGHCKIPPLLRHLFEFRHLVSSGPLRPLRLVQDAAITVSDKKNIWRNLTVYRTATPGHDVYYAYVHTSKAQVPCNQHVLVRETSRI